MKKFPKFFSIIMTYCLVFSVFLLLLPQASAATMPGTVTLSSYDAGATKVTATFNFEPLTKVTAGDKIKITAANGFNLSSVTNNDVTITTVKGSVKKNKATINNSEITITFSSVSSPDGLYTVTIANITNPVAGSYVINMATLNNSEAIIDSGNISISIGANTITINDKADPVLSLSLSANTCDLGTLAAKAVATCSYNLSLATNAPSGFTAFIKADGDLSSGSSIINPVSDDTVTADKVGYGVATNGQKSANIDIAAAVICPASGGTNPVYASALTLNDQALAYAPAPSSEVITVCHAAAINATTSAGAYNQTATITLISNF